MSLARVAIADRNGGAVRRNDRRPPTVGGSCGVRERQRGPAHSVGGLPGFLNRIVSAYGEEL